MFTNLEKPFSLNQTCLCFDNLLGMFRAGFLPPANGSCGEVMFLQVSVILFTGGGWYPSMHCRSPGPHPGGKLRDLAWGGLQAHTQGEVEGSGLGGVSRPTPRGKLRGLAWGGLQAYTWGCLQAHIQGFSRHTTGGGLHMHTLRGSPGTHPGVIPACTEAGHPPSRRLLLRSVRILLECILVVTVFLWGIGRWRSECL